ncbi:MAG: dihydrofolate reductase family protein [Cyclobacteriaceae bacterium]
MRKVILNVAMSLDGLIEGPNGEYDWCFADQACLPEGSSARRQDYGMTEFLARIDAIFYGRRSYEVMMRDGNGKNPFGAKQSFVFSSTLPASVEYALINKQWSKQVREIKRANGKDIWLFGGAALTQNLLEENLVDELLLAVHPIVLGRGKPMFSDLTNRQSLTLLNSQVYSTGLVSLHYQLK